MIFDTKYLQKLTELNAEMKAVFGGENLAENIEKATFQFKQLKSALGIEPYYTMDNDGKEVATLVIPPPINNPDNNEPELPDRLCYEKTWIDKFIVSEGWYHLGVNTWRGCKSNIIIELPMSIKRIPVSSSSPFHGLTDITLIIPNGFVPTSTIDLRYQTNWDENKVRTLFEALGETANMVTINLASSVYNNISEKTKAIATDKGWAVSSA